VSYFLCYLWEKYSQWSEGQLPPTFNQRGKWLEREQIFEREIKEIVRMETRVGFEAAMQLF
jgi:hypothetical protein